MELQQIESVREIVAIPRRREGLWVLRGELLDEIRQELVKGDRARWTLREIVEQGMTGGKEPVDEQG